MSASPLTLFRTHLGTFLVAVAAGAIVALGVRAMFLGDVGGAPTAAPHAQHAGHEGREGHEGHAAGAAVPAEATPGEATPADPHAGHVMEPTPAPPPAEPPPAGTGVLLALGNANCPVMGGPATGEVYTDWNGLRVNHCCAGCTERFLEDPETLLDDVSPGWREALEMAQSIDAAAGEERARLLDAAAERWTVLRRSAEER